MRSSQPVRQSCLWICAAAFYLLFSGIPDSMADYKGDIGFTALKTELGAAIPDGRRLSLVTQTEAATNAHHGKDEETGRLKVWMPDPRRPEFSGKKILNRSGSLPYYSGHATGVGRLFYGKNSSIAPGISTVECFLADHWLGPGYLESSAATNPRSSSSRIANHSWVASTNGNNPSVLRRIDWVVGTDETIQVVGPCRPGNPLLGSAFNTIAVGEADGESGKGTAAVDALYTAGRSCPQLVAPRKTASSAAPVVAAAAALLVEVGHGDPGLSRDPVLRRTANRNGDTIYNAERSEVVKAALMAGADRVTRNTEVIGGNPIDIEDYRKDSAHRSPNGLDRRYGAGQVNIGNSYHIIAGGEQNSLEDMPESGGIIGRSGFDYDPAFGGENGSNTVATYYFTADKDSTLLRAALVWNIDIDAGAGPHFAGSATLYDLDLFLYDVTGTGEPRQVAASTAPADNTENLWVGLGKNRRYMIQVKPGSRQSAFKWDYALAWHVTRQ